MKFLLCGCFHGKVPKKLFNVIKKEKPDLIISTGDYGDGKFLRKWEFKHWKNIEKLILSGDYKKVDRYYNTKENLKYAKKDLETAKTVLNKLKKIKNKLYYTYGNHDGYSIKLLKSFSKKNFKFIPKGKIKFKDYTLIFHGGYRGTYGKPYMIDWKNANEKHKNSVKKRILEINKDLNTLFSKKDKDIIFVTHDPPYGTKLDILKKDLDKMNRYKHIGDDIYTKFDKKFQPLVHICSHMHENQGYDKIGKTLVVNSGALLESKFALLELKKNKIKNLKFYK